MDKKVEDKWLNDFRNRMEDYSEPLPEGLWEELEGELTQPKVIPFWRRWPSVAAAVALVLVASSLMLSQWFYPVINEEDTMLADQLVADSSSTYGVNSLLETGRVKTTSAEVLAETSSSNTNELRRNDSQSGASKMDELRRRNLLSDASNIDEQQGRDLQSDTSQKDEQQGRDLQSDEPQKNYSQTRQSSPRSYTSSTRARTTADAGYVAMNRARKNDAGGIELGIHAGGIPYNSSKQFKGMSRMASHSAISLAPVVMGSVNSKMTPYNQVLFNNRDKRTSTDVKHHMPVNVVASVKWHFANKWALESGLSYTFLQSELHSGSQLYWEDTQKLHYVGIPIKLHRTIWGNNLFSFYASAGGMLEKCVSGSLESVYVTSNSTREVEKHKVHSRPYQWSVSAAMGAQVNLVRKLSIFVEPGVAYFFDDNSELETIRQEHPFNFNLQFGLRFTLND